MLYMSLWSLDNSDNFEQENQSPTECPGGQEGRPQFLSIEKIYLNECNSLRMASGNVLVRFGGITCTT